MTATAPWHQRHRGADRAGPPPVDCTLEVAGLVLQVVEIQPAFADRTLREGGTRVPLIVRWPARIPAGVAPDGAAISMDVTATIHAATGLRSSAAGLDGRDLLLLLEKGEPHPDRALFWATEEEQQAIRHARSATNAVRRSYALTSVPPVALDRL